MVEAFFMGKYAVLMVNCTILAPKVLVRHPTLVVAMGCSLSKAVYGKFSLRKRCTTWVYVPHAV